MPDYIYYPAMDADDNFPPAIRTAIANSPEMTDKFDAKAPLNSPAFTGTPTGITRYHVGLDKVDNVADANKKLAQGLLYKDVVLSHSNYTIAAIINHVASFTFRAGRRYRIVWDTSYYQSDSNSLFYWDICFAPVEDAPVSMDNLIPMGGRTKGSYATIPETTQHTGAITVYYEPTVSSTRQIKFRIQRVVGEGMLKTVGNENEFGHYLIYDDGSQTLPNYADMHDE